MSQTNIRDRQRLPSTSAPDPVFDGQRSSSLKHPDNERAIRTVYFHPSSPRARIYNEEPNRRPAQANFDRSDVIFAGFGWGDMRAIWFTLALSPLAMLALWPAATARVRAQSPVVTREWRCLAASADAGALRASPVPGCPAPPNAAPIHLGPSSTTRSVAVALVMPGVPSSLSATVSGNTVVLTWSPPTSGDVPTSYVLEAGSASGRNDVANSDTGFGIDYAVGHVSAVWHVFYQGTSAWSQRHE